jgi:coiled-coil domain-containing protein 130
VGSYHSTKIWAFTMRHHCGCRITIETDPKNAEYVVKDGARRKVEEYDPADAGTVQLPDEAERHALNADPLSRLERSTEQARAAATGRAALAALAADREEKRDGYALNKRLRAQLRASKKEDAALDDRWARALGAPGAWAGGWDSVYGAVRLYGWEGEGCAGWRGGAGLRQADGFKALWAL